MSEAQGKYDNDNISIQPKSSDDANPTTGSKLSEGLSSQEKLRSIFYRVEYKNKDGKVVKNDILQGPFNSDDKPNSNAVILELVTTVQQVFLDPDSQEETKSPENNESKQKSMSSSRTIITGHTLNIHSEYLINALRSIVAKYNVCFYTPMTFEFPFKWIMNYIDELKTYRSENPDHHSEEYTRCSNEHIDLLIRFLDEFPDLKPVHNELLRNAGEQPKFTYDYLWTTFKPGEFCYIQERERLTGPFVIDYCDFTPGEEEVNSPLVDFKVAVWNVHFNGVVMGRVSRTIPIEKSTGERLISTLKVIPVKYCKDSSSSLRKDNLIARGKSYWELAKEPAYMKYNGKSLQKPPSDINDHVMIDPKVFSSRNWNMPEMGFPEMDYELQKYEAALFGCQCDSCKAKPPRGPPYKDFDDLDPQTDKPPNEEAFYMLCDERVFGFTLKNRKWNVFNIENLQSVSRVNSFENLVLPQNLKRTIKALTASFARDSKEPNIFSADLTRGKGEGKIILLHGPPGVGKTATAEAISDLIQKPLLALTCGDLGVTAVDVERGLNDFFELGERWNAVVLLDEADIYLEARDLKDITRNSLVSIFLRALEYYQGLLFLTTNRIKTFDEAFKSRIHVSLRYPSLQKEERREIWENHFRTLKEKNVRIEDDAKQYIFKDKEVRDLKWNGREIRNAFSTALSLAADDAHERGQSIMIITLDHMKNVAMLSKGFKDYIKALHDGRDDEYLAKVRDLRHDSFKAPSDLVPSKRQGGGGFKPYRPNDEKYGGLRGEGRTESNEEGGRSLMGQRGKSRSRDDEDESEENHE